MGFLSVLGGNEEKKFSWDPGRPDQVREAREAFVRYQREGYLACKIEAKGKRGVHIVEFDPQAEEIFMLGLIDGG